MDRQFFLLSAAIPAVMALALFLFALFKFSQLPFFLRLVGILSGVSFLCDFVSFFLGGPARNYSGNIYRLLEFLILLLIFNDGLTQRRRVGQFIVVGVAYGAFFLLNFLFIEREQMNSYSNVISSLVFISLSLFYFYRLMNDMPATQIQRLPMFWVAMSILVYFSGSLTIFLLSHYLRNADTNQLAIFWSFHNFLNIVKNTLFAIALWQNQRIWKSP